MIPEELLRTRRARTGVSPKAVKHPLSVSGGVLYEWANRGPPFVARGHSALCGIPMVGGKEMFPGREGALFAPVNWAFAKLSAGTVETLLKPENKDTLVQALRYSPEMTRRPGPAGDDNALPTCGLRAKVRRVGWATLTERKWVIC